MLDLKTTSGHVVSYFYLDLKEKKVDWIKVQGGSHLRYWLVAGGGGAFRCIQSAIWGCVFV